VYVTFNVSPDTTVRSPGDSKSAAENSTPEVPDVAAHTNAPATTPPELEIENAVGEEEFVTTDGSAVVGVPKVICGRTPPE